MYVYGCDRVTGHCNVSVAGQESCVKKVHDKENIPTRKYINMLREK